MTGELGGSGGGGVRDAETETVAGKRASEREKESREENSVAEKSVEQQNINAFPSSTASHCVCVSWVAGALGGGGGLG